MILPKWEGQGFFRKFVAWFSALGPFKYWYHDSTEIHDTFPVEAGAGFSQKFVSWFSTQGPFSTGIMVEVKFMIQGVVKPSL